MEKTQLPLVKWFWAMFLMGDKRGCSALYLSKQLGVAYSTAWAISHKIRTAMGSRDTMYMLDGAIEIDDAFFGGTRKGSKRGRGTDKTAVLVGLSLNKQGKPLFVKMSAVENVKVKTITEFAKENIKSGSFVSSDGYKSYNKLCGEGYSHEGKDFDSENDPDHLKWLHIVISNAKAFILGAYHGLDSLHIQSMQPYHAVRIIADEGAAVLPILKRIAARTDHADYQWKLDKHYLNQVLLCAYDVAERHKGVTAYLNTKPVRLSKQQKYILTLLAQGYNNAEIVSITGLTINTIKAHTKVTYSKLNVHKAADAVLEAKRLGIIES